MEAERRSAALLTLNKVDSKYEPTFGGAAPESG
jgi:hypothetical protein